MSNWGRAVIISTYVLFLLLCPPCSADVVDEQIEITYGGGWTHYNYTDGTQAHKFSPSNYLRWDGKWRPKTELNLLSGDWPYLIDEFETYYLITRLDDSLILSKTYRFYNFQPYKIGVQLTLTPVQLNGLSTSAGDYWYITIPQSLKQTSKHLNWDNKIPTVSNETGFVLNQSDNVSGEWVSNYQYHNVGSELRLYYNQAARNFGIASTEIEFRFDSYIINSSTSPPWVNTSFDSNTTIKYHPSSLYITLGMFGTDNMDSYVVNSDANGQGDWETTGTDASNYAKFITDLSDANNQVIKYEESGDGTHTYLYYNKTDSGYSKIIEFDFEISSTGGDDHYIQIYNQSGSVNSRTVVMKFQNDFKILSYDGSGYVEFPTPCTWSVGTRKTYRMEYFNDTHYEFFIDSVSKGKTLLRCPNTDGHSKISFNGYKTSQWTTYLDNIHMYNESETFFTTGNVTHWHDAGTWYQTASFIVNMTTPTNTNYTVWYADNGSSFTQIGGVYTGNQTPSISGTKYQNTDLRIIMSGNVTATPVEMEVTFVTEVAAAGNPSNITYWQNNKTNNNSLDIIINTSEEVNFNATANQSITTWNWSKDDMDQSHNYDNITLNWSSAGLKHVVVNATNPNGTSGSITWNISVICTGYTVSGTIYGAAGLGEGQVTVTLGSDSTTTSSSGAYSFTGVSAGTYTLTASKPGLQDASTTITVSGDTTQDLTMARAVSPAGGGQQGSDWWLPFNISGPISRLDGLFAPLQVPSDPGKINIFWYCILGFGAFMFIDGTSFRFDNSRKAPVIKLKYLISAPLSLMLIFLGLLYIGLINWNSVFFINTFDGLALSFSSAISSLLGVTSPLGAVGYVLVGTGILVLGALVFIDGLAFCVDKSRENTFLKIKYQVLIAAGLGLGVLGAVVSGLVIFS